MLNKQIIGEGRTATEALLFARINQIGYDKGIKDKTISKKTKAIEIPVELFTIDCDKIISAVHFGYYYYYYQKEMLNGNDSHRKFTETEYRYFSLLIKRLGRQLFNQVMEAYCSKNSEECIAVKYRENVFKFMY